MNSGVLVSIPDKDTNDFLIKMLTNKENWKAWTGGRKSSNTWSWLDGTEFTFTMWDEPQQPDNSGGNENHLEIWHSGFWNDAPENTPRAFICQNIPSSSTSNGLRSAKPPDNTTVSWKYERVCHLGWC